MKQPIRRRSIGWIATLLALGFASHSAAQSTPSVPDIAPTQQSPIAYDQTVQGSLDATDPILPDGSLYDVYTFQAQAGQGYFITVQSDSFVAASLIVAVPQSVDGQTTPLQLAQVFQPGARVEYAGTLEQSGGYAILVTTADPTLSGAYTISLTELQPAGGQTAACIGGTRPAPIAVRVGDSLDCTLTDQDVAFLDQNGTTHFGKYFSYESDGQAVTISARSQTLTPLIAVWDPLTGQQTGPAQPDSATVQFPPGTISFAVIAQENDTTGDFSVSVAPSSAPAQFQDGS